MFKLRKHKISNNDALDKRKLKENYLFFANQLSEIGSDSIARSQLKNADFELDSFIEFKDTGYTYSSDRKGQIQGDVGTSAAIINSIESFDIQGDYSISWTIQVDLLRTKNGNTATTGDYRFVAVVPFMGATAVSSAESSFHEMGFINNTDCVDVEISTPDTFAPRKGSDEKAFYERTTEVFDQYGRWMAIRKGDMFTGSGYTAPKSRGVRKMASQVKNPDSSGTTKGINTGFCKHAKIFR